MVPVVRYMCLAVFLPLVVGACSAAPVDPADEARLKAAGYRALSTDRASYTATYEDGDGSYRRYGFTVVARYTNRTKAPIYLARCYPDSPHPIYGVNLVEDDDSWRAWYNGAWACVGHESQIVVPSGGTRVDTLRLSGPTAWDGVTGQPLGVSSGRMQLAYEVQSCRGDGECRLPRAAGLSNEFEVTRQP